MIKTLYLQPLVIAAGLALSASALAGSWTVVPETSSVGFVVAEAIIFLPLLAIAIRLQPGIVESAVGVTLLGTGGLTAVAFITRKDFSFLRGVLVWGGILALIGIVASVLFGFDLGTWFSVAMIGFAGAAVLFDTSNILHHYPEDRYVGAALALFASIALMFWYVLRLFMSRD